MNSWPLDEFKVSGLLSNVPVERDTSLTVGLHSPLGPSLQGSREESTPSIYLASGFFAFAIFSLSFVSQVDIVTDRK